MEENVKKILYKQLELLAEESEDLSGEELAKLTHEMVNLANLLLVPQNQSFYGASTNHPYVVQLPIKDLVDLYAVRAQLEHQYSGPHKR